MKNQGILLTCLILCQYSIFAQEYLTTSYGMSEGLSSPKTERLVQSSNGFIWIATNLGVSSFDGYRFINYSGVDGQTLGSVQTIAEDHNGTIWIGSTEGLFFIKNKKIHSTPWLRINDADNSIQDILFDQAGNLWVCSGRGPYRIPEDQLLQSYNDPTCCEHIPTISAWTNLKLADKRCNRIILVEDSIPIFANNFYVFKYKDQKLIQLFRSPPGTVSKINSIVSYKDTLLWAAGESHLYKSIHANTRPYHTDIKFPVKIILSDSLTYVMTVFELYKIKDGQVTSILNFKDHHVTYPQDFLIDIEGNIWIASWSGLLQVKKSPFNLVDQKKHPNNPEIFAVHAIDSGEMLLGGNYGSVLKLDCKEDQINIKQIKQVVPRSEIVDFHSDKMGDMWMASTYQGLIRKENSIYTNFTRSDGLADNGFHCLFMDHEGVLWAGGDGGITQIQIESNKDITFKNYRYPITDATYLQVQFGLTGPNEHLWLGTNLGLFQLLNDSISAYSLINGDQSMIFDGQFNSKNILWLATSSHGLLQCTFGETGQLSIHKGYSAGGGLYSNAYIDLLLDSQNRLWAASYDEICLIQNHENLNDVNIICFDQNDGFPLNGYHHLKMEESSNGYILVASTQGMSYFNPEDIVLNSRPPFTHIHDILLDGERTDLSSFTDSINPLNGLPEKLSLPYNKNYVSFDFSGISLTNSSKIVYQFVLDGVDKSWQTTRQNKIINYSNLLPGDYTFKVIASNNHGIWNKSPQELQFEIRPPFWKTWWFILASCSLLLSSIIFYFKRREDLLRKTEAEKNRVNNLIAELKIKAIRAQMNPHFIFNCLNSIQACIVEQKHEVAMHYLSKFARLLRLVLNYCELDVIELEKEIEFLTLYLELEQLRFGESLQYFIDVDLDADLDGIYLPSFLIQPFIENSIWHGLLHKSEDRKLWLRFSISESDDLLECVIEDNGIGREKSKELKANRTKSIEHQSKGMRLSTDRLDLIKLKSPKGVNFSVHDKKDSNNRALGTIVSLSLPI